MTATFTRRLIEASLYMGQTAERSVPVLAETTPTPGLAVIPSVQASSDDPQAGGYTGGWMVLHLVSGRTVVGGAVPGLAQARYQSLLLGALPIDWTADHEHIKATCDAKTREAVHTTFLDAYAFGWESEEDDDDDC